MLYAELPQRFCIQTFFKKIENIPGELIDYQKTLAALFGIENRVHFLGYRKDVAQLFKAADTARGVNEPLTVYRISRGSKSGNKLKSAITNRRTYKYIGLNPFVSAYYMCRYTLNGIRKYSKLK